MKTTISPKRELKKKNIKKFNKLHGKMKSNSKNLNLLSTFNFIIKLENLKIIRKRRK
jgi:hypothetical protein